MRAAVQPVPDHVPQELVSSFNLFTGPGMEPAPMGDPHAAIETLLAGPPVFFAPGNTRNGEGTWVVVRAEDQRRVLQDGETFSSNRNIFASALGESWPMIPLEIDPPEHSKWRSLLNPLLSPRRVIGLEPIVRERAISLIEAMKSRGTDADVMKDFCLPFAVSIFLQFLGIGSERLEEFVGWATDLLHGTPAQRTEAARTVVSFLDELRDLRRQEPTDDFMSFVTQARIEGESLSDMEVRGMSVLLFIAGLDTVAAALGFDFYYLAQHADQQELLRTDPKRIQLAAEEMLRAFPSVTPVRRATRDVELQGITIRKGDLVACPSMTANRDPAEFPDAGKIVLNREDNRHVAFAYGPHRCLGSHLARREIVIGLEEFLARIPTFRIKPGTAPITHGGFVFGVDNLQLDWSEQEKAQ
ncbi:cytochrome [Croceicoccus estronivorus]|uniref:cytochrome P450 n=1 Tax=Croceicoccus estronivorus TaxID=1172626 RepID=UPI000832A0F6|nr:cytochrome P450 [Croceicoccus estronivorus]OCC23509.1 cytochrome [Croceicoccus estronivorus]